MKRYHLKYKYLILIYILFNILNSCKETTEVQDLFESSSETKEQYNKRIQWWKEARFGLIIHWGPGVLSGDEISWARHGPRPGLGNPDSSFYGPGTIPPDIYDNYYKQFNPTGFNADEWAQIAKSAGAGYLIFSTKHWDGFCNFDSKFTDYKITSKESPFRRDLTAEFVAACRRNGIRAGLYYAPEDWHDTNYRTNNHRKFLDLYQNQVQELLNNYGLIDMIWFDGGFPPEDRDAEVIYDKIKNIQPDIIINDRLTYCGDYTTPEHRLGDFNSYKPWESCWGLGVGWSWRPVDTLLSLKWCINKLVDCAGRDGNFLLGISPGPSGKFDQDEIDRLKEIGSWLTNFGESIYKTHGGPFLPDYWGASTYKDSTIYIHITNWSGDLYLNLPPIKQKILKCYLLTGGEVTFSQSKEKLQFNVQQKYLDALNTIIVIKLDTLATMNPIFK